MEESSSQKMEITTRVCAGGSEMQELIHDYILKYLASSDSWKKEFKVEVSLEDLDDSSVVNNIVVTKVRCILDYNTIEFVESGFPMFESFDK